MKAKQFLVIGAGRFGSALATTLFELGHEVVVIDENEQEIETIMSHVSHAVIADATDEDTLARLGVSNFDHVIVAIGDDLEANILTTVAAKSLRAKHLISKAKDQLSARVLEKVGADEVIRPEHDMGVRLAMQLATPSIVDAFHLGEQHGVLEVDARDKLTGKLKNLQISNRFALQIIAVTHQGKLIISPGADFEIQTGDKVVLVGNNDAIERFRNYLSQ